MNQVEQGASFGAAPAPVTDAETIAILRAQVSALTAAIGTLGSAADADEVVPQGTMDQQGFPKEYVWMTIFPGRDKQDQSYVPIGLKGYVIKVTRGFKVAVPKVFANILEDAMEEITVKSEGGLITRPALRFPYTIHGTCTPEEYDVFRKTQVTLGADAAVKR